MELRRIVCADGGRDAALCVAGIALFDAALSNGKHGTVLFGQQGSIETGDATANDDVVVVVLHNDWGLIPPSPSSWRGGRIYLRGALPLLNSLYDLGPHPPPPFSAEKGKNILRGALPLLNSLEDGFAVSGAVTLKVNRDRKASNVGGKYLYMGGQGGNSSPIPHRTYPKLVDLVQYLVFQ